MLGYYSLVGLLRLHSLLGDYYQAIKVLENIELNKKVSAGDKKYLNIYAFSLLAYLYVALKLFHALFVFIYRVSILKCQLVRFLCLTMLALHT